MSLVRSCQVLVEHGHGILDHVDLHPDALVHDAHAADCAVDDAAGLGEVLVTHAPDAVHPTGGGLDVLLQVVPAGPLVLPGSVGSVEEHVLGAAERAGVMLRIMPRRDGLRQHIRELSGLLLGNEVCK